MFIEIKKPLYKTKDGLVVGIYNKRVLNAQKRGEKIIIKCENCQEEFNPDWIIKNCGIMKKIFLRPEEPMILYKIFLKENECDKKVGIN